MRPRSTPRSWPRCASASPAPARTASSCAPSSPTARRPTSSSAGCCRCIASTRRWPTPRPATHQVLVARVLGEVVARADRQKQRGGQLDFHDMLRLTDRALDADAGLAGRLATRLPWALIDEFQDTDPIQWRIASKIWRRPPARALVIVGDPKQAIYSFRGGDVHTYLAATRELCDAGAARATLEVNQRSTVALVAAVNRLLARPRSLFVGSMIADTHPVRASGEVSATWADGRPVAPIALYDHRRAPTRCRRAPSAVRGHRRRDRPAGQRPRPSHRRHRPRPSSRTRSARRHLRADPHQRGVDGGRRRHPRRGVPCAFLHRPSTCSRPRRRPTSPTCSTPWPTRAIARRRCGRG
jgi:hypothetical protein